MDKYLQGLFVLANDAAPEVRKLDEEDWGTFLDEDYEFGSYDEKLLNSEATRKPPRSLPRSLVLLHSYMEVEVRWRKIEYEVQKAAKKVEKICCDLDNKKKELKTVLGNQQRRLIGDIQKLKNRFKNVKPLLKKKREEEGKVRNELDILGNRLLQKPTIYISNKKECKTIIRLIEKDEWLGSLKVYDKTSDSDCRAIQQVARDANVEVDMQGMLQRHA